MARVLLVFAMLALLAAERTTARVIKGTKPGPGDPERQEGEPYNPKSDFSTQIVGGEIVTEKKYNWMVSLQDRANHFCGGALIAPEYVLTAAHCVYGYNPPRRLILGQYHLDGDFEDTRIKRRVASIIIHEGYNTHTLENDIALIKLNGAVRSIEPIPIETDRAFYESRIMTRVIGWGLISEDGRGSIDLRKVDIPLVSYQTCTHRRSYRKNEIFRDKNLCAGYTRGKKDACQGDSGGPLFRVKDDGTFAQMGIVSWGEGCARPFKYGVYTRLDAYVKWIQEHTGPLQSTESPTMPTLSPTAAPVGYSDWFEENQFCQKQRRKRNCKSTSQYQCQFVGRRGCISSMEQPATERPTSSPTDYITEEMWREADSTCRQARTKRSCRRKGQCSFLRRTCSTVLPFPTTRIPTVSPTERPTKSPTTAPTLFPTSVPSTAPTFYPTLSPEADIYTYGSYSTYQDAYTSTDDYSSNDEQDVGNSDENKD